MEENNPVKIVLQALNRGYPLVKDTPNTIFKAFGTKRTERDPGPGLYISRKEDIGTKKERWVRVDISYDTIIQIAYSLSREELKKLKNVIINN